MMMAKIKRIKKTVNFLKTPDISLDTMPPTITPTMTGAANRSALS